MLTISIPTMKSMISQIGIAKRRTLYFHGPSGIGKSEGIQQSCTEHDGVMCDIRVSQYESIDFRGIPDVQGRETVWNMPSTLPFKGNAKFEMADPSKPIYLFLDEINQGDPSVMSVCYQLCNDYRIGEHVLLDNVVIICAGNRAQDRGATNKFPAPLANRMTHAELVADIKSWTKWAGGANVPAGLVGFLNFRDGLLHTFDSNKPQTVFATPRTWSFVAEDMQDPTLSDDVRLASMAGSVGEGPATELQGFLAIMSKLQPIEYIIANPEKADVSSELDIQWAMASHVAGNMTADTVTPLTKYLNRLEAEMAVMAWTMAINKDKDLTDTDAFLYDYAPKYRGLFQN